MRKMSDATAIHQYMRILNQEGKGAAEKFFLSLLVKQRTRIEPDLNLLVNLRRVRRSRSARPSKALEPEAIKRIVKKVGDRFDPIPKLVLAAYRLAPTPEIRRAILQAVPKGRRKEIEQLLQSIDQKNQE